MKKLVAVILAFVFCASLSTPVMAISTEESKDMSTLDVIVSAYLCAGSIDSARKEPNEIIYVTAIEPLYDLDDRITAYYVVFSSGCYAVVANNTDNPSVIEFGEGTNRTIEKLLAEDTSSKLIYNNPMSVYSENYLKMLSESERKKVIGIYDFYPEILKKNETLASQLSDAKSRVVRLGLFTPTRGDGDFGFFNSSDMPTGNYTSRTITQATSVDWAVMNDYNNIASNHCGATAVTNLALYFAKRGNSNLKINNSKRDTFVAVHQIVGNGPSLTIASSAVTYFSNRGYTLNHSGVGNTSAIKTAINNNRPCGILLADGLFSWHWIIGVGWRQYTSNNDFYIRINNNWDNTVNIYYKPGTGSAWWSATAYWVS